MEFFLLLTADLNRSHTNRDALKWLLLLFFDDDEELFDEITDWEDEELENGLNEKFEGEEMEEEEEEENDDEDENNEEGDE